MIFKEYYTHINKKKIIIETQEKDYYITQEKDYFRNSGKYQKFRCRPFIEL